MVKLIAQREEAETGNLAGILMRCVCVFVASAMLLVAAPRFDADHPGFGPASALADDDDDDDDDDDGGSGGGGSGASSSGGSGSSSSGRTLRNSGGSLLKNLRRTFRVKPKPRRATRPATKRRTARSAPAPRPEMVPNEIVALGLGDDNIVVLETQGYAVEERYDVAIGGLDTAIRLRIPSGTTLDDARTAVRALNPAAVADFNHYYRTDQDDATSSADEAAPDEAMSCEGPHCAAPQMVSWPASDQMADACTGPVRIGMIDTGINADHTVFQNGRLELVDLDHGDKTRSRKTHGTAVAALLLGDPHSRSPGLLPDATLVAVDAFHRGAGNDERSDVFSLVKALDAVAGRDVTVINLSLSGPDNTLLATVTDRLIDAGTVLVAAAGNGGPRSKPVYPAAYDGVITVTAVDRDKRVYRRAARGPHIDLAAPGVNVWTAASVKGARWKTGTSFATPFVSAAAALAKLSAPRAEVADIASTLTSAAIDLGEPGRDDVFGHGLLNASDLCVSQQRR